MEQQTAFREKIRHIQEIANSAPEESPNEAELYTSLCEDIHALSEQANSLAEVNFFIDTLESASTLLDKHNGLNNEYWKLNLKEMGKNLVSVIRNESGWVKLEEPLNGVFPDPVSVTFLYNTVRTQGLDINSDETESISKSQKVRNKRTGLNKQANLTKPMKILGQSSNNVDTYELKMIICMEKLYEVCDFDEYKSIPFYTFAINCLSYTQTVYNIFILSFLIKNHLIVVSVDQNHQLLIRPAQNYQTKNKILSAPESKEDEIKFQSILSINPAEWKMLIQKLKLKTSMLPVLFPDAQSLGDQVRGFSQLTNGVIFME